MLIKILTFTLLVSSTFSQDTILVRDTYLNPKPTENIVKSESFSPENDFLFLPNTSVSKGSNKTRFLQVRGIGQRENFSPLVRRYNHFFIDHIDYSSFPQAFELYNFGTTKINYGPSLKGAAASTFETKSASHAEKHQLKMHMTRGSYGHQSQKAAFKASKKTILKPSFSVIRIKEDGFYKNTFLKRDDTNNRDEFYLRSQLNSPNFFKQNLSYRFHYNRLNNGYDAFVQDNSETMVSDHPGQDDLNMQVHQLGLHSGKRNKVFLEYMKSYSLYSYDEDWGNNTKWLNFEGFNHPYNYFIEFIRNKERYSVKDIYADRNNKLEISYMQSKESHLERGYNEEAPRSNIDTLLREKNIAIQGEHTLTLTDEFSLSIGLGAQSHHLDMSNDDRTETIKEELLNGSMIANYKKLFASLKTVEVPGGINVQSAVPANRAIYKKERVSTLETGLKTNNHRLNLFYTTRNNAQVKTSYQDDPSDPSSFTYYNDNTTSTDHYGLELSNQLNITKWFQWNSSVSFLKTSYGDYPFENRNLKGREVPNSPEYQFHFKPTFRPTRESLISLGYYQQDNFYFSNSHDQRGRGYSLVNLEIGYQFNKARITFKVDNLLDESYQTRGFYFGNNPPNFESELYTQLGRPRFIGLSLDMSI